MKIVSARWVNVKQKSKFFKKAPRRLLACGEKEKSVLIPPFLRRRAGG